MASRPYFSDLKTLSASRLAPLLRIFSSGTWKVFHSFTGFLVPDSSVRNPDASVVRWERWRALSAVVEQRLALEKEALERKAEAERSVRELLQRK